MRIHGRFVLGLRVCGIRKGALSIVAFWGQVDKVSVHSIADIGLYVTEDIDQKTLISAAAGGSHDAYAQLVREYEQRIRGYCRRMLDSDDSGDDVAQEVFIKAYKALGTYRSEAKFSTWLYKIATNLCLDHLRKSKREKWFRQLYSMVAQTSHTVALQKDHAASDVLGHLLSAISSDHRQVLLLKEREGFSYEEISRILGISIDAVRGRLKRARQDALAHYEKMTSIER